MSYLLDQGLARSTVDHLRDMGIESEHVGTLGMAAASDSEFLEESRKRGWVVVTLDADFHALLALSEASKPSVIRIRIEGIKGEKVASIIARVQEAAAIDVPLEVRPRRIPRASFAVDFTPHQT